MNEKDLEIIGSKMLMIRQALSELPQSILALKIREVNYDHVNVIANCLLSVVSVDVRPFWAAFNRDWSMQLQAITMDLYKNESAHDRTLGQLVSFPWYCAFLLANAQCNLCGSGSLSDALQSNKTENIAYCMKISQSNANVMFQRIYMLNITGKKPSGCAGLLLLCSALPMSYALAKAYQAL